MYKMGNSSNTGNSVSFLGLLTIVIIVLKLTKVLNWSWFWVLSPIIISVIVGIILIAIHFWLGDKK
jgi:uncharacterized membrane-anchored protein